MFNELDGPKYSVLPRNYQHILVDNGESAIDFFWCSESKRLQPVQRGGERLLILSCCDGH